MMRLMVKLMLMLMRLHCVWMSLRCGRVEMKIQHLLLIRKNVCVNVYVVDVLWVTWA